MYDELLKFAVQLAKAAGGIQLAYFRGDRLSIETKSNVYDVVTRADRESEELIAGMIAERYPDHAILGFAFGLMAEIERNLISMRTKEALARRKQEGMTLGRKKGDTPKIKLLRANKRVLTKELDKGTTYSELAEKMGVSRTTLFRFMKTMY